MGQISTCMRTFSLFR